MKEKKWKPRKAEVYWVMGCDGDATRWYWVNDATDRRRYHLGNVFRTKRETLEAKTRVRKALKNEQ